MRVLFFRNFANAKFVKIKHLRNGEITLSLIDVCKSCPGREFYCGYYVFFTIFAKIKFSLKFPNLQLYHLMNEHNGWVHS